MTHALDLTTPATIMVSRDAQGGRPCASCGGQGCAECEGRGRGWGQGPQHSQSLQAWFAHVPGLKCVVPTTAYNAKGLMISAIRDNNPVMFVEHRLLYYTDAYVPEESFTVPLGKADLAKIYGENAAKLLKL